MYYNSYYVNFKIEKTVSGEIFVCENKKLVNNS